MFRFARPLAVRSEFDATTPFCLVRSPLTKYCTTSLPPDALRPPAPVGPLLKTSNALSGLNVTTVSVCLQVPAAARFVVHEFA